MLEVGLGGRLDATNVVDAEVCVLTSIGIEHTEYLGEDVATIAGEKLAIAGPNSTLVSGPLPDQALEVADARPRPASTTVITERTSRFWTQSVEWVAA